MSFFSWGLIACSDQSAQPRGFGRASAQRHNDELTWESRWRREGGVAHLLRYSECPSHGNIWKNESCTGETSIPLTVRVNRTHPELPTTAGCPRLAW